MKDFNVTPYNYNECYAYYKATGNLEALAEWFERYGDECWNGESYELENGERLFPLYEEVDEDNFEIVGYEVR